MIGETVTIRGAEYRIDHVAESWGGKWRVALIRISDGFPCRAYPGRPTLRALKRARVYAV